VGAIKISLITVTFNAGSTIERCIQSVISQTHKNVEYIIVDGASTDATVQIVTKYSSYIRRFVSEPDHGIYDAMNKGINFATGDVIGMLNADDYFSDNSVLADIAGVFEDKDVLVLYGDLDYVNELGNIFRKWRSGRYTTGKFNWGWMPPHPTFYCRRELFGKYGFYSLSYGTAADYELMLRFMHKHGLNSFYLEKVIVKMKTGGASNKNLSSRVKGLVNDFRAMGHNGIRSPFITVFLKRLRKIGQYL
jgi:glycosyltransferase involved in cell wall biosynthesis